MRPATVKEGLAVHPDHVRQRHQHSLAEGLGKVYVPNMLQRKYPHASSTWGWQM
jgi:hypothetical protein